MTLENTLNLENMIPFKICEKEIKVGDVNAFLMKKITLPSGKSRQILYDLKGYKVSETLFDGDRFDYYRKDNKLIIKHYSAITNRTYTTSQDNVWQDKQYCWNERKPAKD